MTDIYQEIWTADQEKNGIPALGAGETGDADEGYVVVNPDLDTSRDPDLRVLSDVKIPVRKAETYELCRKLFNNYALPEAAREIDTPEERAERHAFIEAILDTPPMLVARDYVGDRTGTPISRERWHNTLIELWFRRYSMGGDPELSGFEHVVVGEQEGGKVQGYHFWYKYYLDDGFAHKVDDGRAVVPGLSDDRITYTGSKAADGQMAFPESVTIQYGWNAPDYDQMAVRPLHKRIGGFFVGCSVEGLMALGTVRAHLGAQAPKTAVIEGARYEMKLFRSHDGRHIRTFYPVFKGAADPVGGGDGPRRRPPGTPPRRIEPGAQGDVRIIAALVNPAGHDPGRESVTIVHSGPEILDITGWLLRDKNGKTEPLDGLSLEPGLPHTVILTGAGAQLSNKGGSVQIERRDGTVVHRVAYSKAQAKRQNRTLVFADG